MILNGKAEAKNLLACVTEAQAYALRCKMPTRVYNFGHGVFGFFFSDMPCIRADLVCEFGPDGRLMLLNLDA